MGRFYLVTHRPPQAEEQFRRALGIDPRYGAALLDLGMTLFHAGRNREAGEIFKRAAVLPAKSYQPAYAIFLLETGQRDAAIAELERLARCDPSDCTARSRIGENVFGGAYLLADAQKAAGWCACREPQRCGRAWQRSELSIDAGKYQDAQNDLNLVLRYRPDTAGTHVFLARLQQAQGRALNQRQELAEALRLDPSLLDVRLDLARLLIALGWRCCRVGDSRPGAGIPEARHPCHR